MLCRALLARPSGDRHTCARMAVEDGYCKFHYNRIVGANRAPVEILAPPPVAAEPTPPRPKHIHTKATMQKPKRTLSGMTFECVICCEENVPVEDNMNLECGDAICQSCFDKLSSVECPFCRREMKSEKITAPDIVKLRGKNKEFKREMEETTFQNWLADDIRNNGPNVPNDLMRQMEVLGALLLQPQPQEFYSPQLDSDEDVEAVNIVVTGMLLGEFNIEDDAETHNSLHDMFPVYACAYLHDLYARCRDAITSK